jgi:hypothetical protein
MPPLTSTIIHPNSNTCHQYRDEVTSYLGEEIASGRMSGPFTLDKVERILGGPVYVSPLLISVSNQQPGTPDKIRICRHLSKGSAEHPSVNSFIRKEDFPTRLDTALQVADVVSPFPPLFPRFEHRDESPSSIRASRWVSP